VTIPAGASISGFAPLASPALTGTPTAPTASTATNTTQIATTAYVKAQAYATLASPTFTGTVTIPAGASISGYLTTSSAASTYQTLSGMSSYLTTSAAASTYYPLSNPSGFITSSALTGYATESWVTSQGYLTDAPSDGNEYVRKNAAWAIASAGGGVAWGAITGTLSSQTDLQTALDDKLALAGGTMTGGLTLSATGIIFSDATTLTTAPSGSTLAADQLTAGVVTANPTTGPTASGDVLQYNGTDLVWAAGGGGGGVAWGAITGTVTDQTDLTTYISGAYYPLSGNPSLFLTIGSLSNSATTTLNATAPTAGQALTYDGTDLVWSSVGSNARLQALAESMRSIVNDNGIGFNGSGNYFIPLLSGALNKPVTNSEFSSSGKWFGVWDFGFSSPISATSVAINSGVVEITFPIYTNPFAGKGLYYTEDGGSTWYESTFKLA
jgi:hypothetical protein